MWAPDSIRGVIGLCGRAPGYVAPCSQLLRAIRVAACQCFVEEGHVTFSNKSGCLGTGDWLLALTRH
eukprot:3499697-Rhodomonas_salina.1